MIGRNELHDDDRLGPPPRHRRARDDRVRDGAALDRLHRRAARRERPLRRAPRRDPQRVRPGHRRRRAGARALRDRLDQARPLRRDRHQQEGRPGDRRQPVRRPCRRARSPSPSSPPTASATEALLAERKPDHVTYEGWEAIDAAEGAPASPTAARASSSAGSRRWSRRHPACAPSRRAEPSRGQGSGRHKGRGRLARRGHARGDRLGPELVRSVGADGVGLQRQDPLQQLDAIDGAGVDAESRLAASFAPGPSLSRKCSTETPATPCANRPRRHRLGRVVGPGHQPRPKAVRSRGRAGCGVEADHLDPVPLAPVSPADRPRRSGRESGIGVRFDLELNRELGRRRLQQVLDEERALVAAELPLSSAATRRAARLRSARAPSPPAWCRSTAAGRAAAQAHRRRSADIRLQSVDRPPEGALERARRGVGAVVASEPVGDQPGQCHRHEWQRVRARPMLPACEQRVNVL